MLVSKENVQKYIPHRAPFIMVDALIEMEENHFKTQYTVPEDNVLLDENSLSESALIECIAQSCALGFGYQHSLKGKEETPLGFIGAVSKLEVFDTVQINSLLDIDIKLISSFDVVQLVEGTITHNNKAIINCQMKIVSP